MSQYDKLNEKELAVLNYWMSFHMEQKDSQIMLKSSQKPLRVGWESLNAENSLVS